jgi:ketosteroid isomerase-like protein
VNGSTDEVVDLVRRWTAAEETGDPTALEPVLAVDFVGIGPLGFVLTREQWLARFGNGLENRAFSVAEPDIHDHGAAVVVVGALDQQTTWQGQDNSGRFRVSALAVRADGAWRLASVHIGPLQTPPGG